MSSVYSEPTELIRLERDPYAEMHQPERPFRIALFGPEMNVMEVEAEHAVLNLNRAEVEALRIACESLLAAHPEPMTKEQEAHEAMGRG